MLSPRIPTYNTDGESRQIQLKQVHLKFESEDEFPPQSSPQYRSIALPMSPLEANNLRVEAIKPPRNQHGTPIQTHAKIMGALGKGLAESFKKINSKSSGKPASTKKKEKATLSSRSPKSATSSKSPKAKNRSHSKDKKR